MAWFYDFCWASGLGIKGNDYEADCHITELEVQLKVLFCRLWTFQEQYKKFVSLSFFSKVDKWATYIFNYVLKLLNFGMLYSLFISFWLRNSKKATKLEKISHLFWHLLSSGKTIGRFFQICGSFSENLNLVYQFESANSKQNFF